MLHLTFPNREKLIPMTCKNCAYVDVKLSVGGKVKPFIRRNFDSAVCQLRSNSRREITLSSRAFIRTMKKRSAHTFARETFLLLETEQVGKKFAPRIEIHTRQMAGVQKWFRKRRASFFKVTWLKSIKSRRRMHLFRVLSIELITSFE